MSKHPASDVLQNLKEANLPSTSQVTSVLETAQETLQKEACEKGYFTGERKLGFDAAKFAGTAKEFIEEKNQGELAQNIIKDFPEAVEELAQILKETEFFKERTQMLGLKHKVIDFTSIAQNKIEAIRFLAQTIINSPQFRSLLFETIDLIQEVFRIEMEKAPTLEKEGTLPLTEEAKLKAKETKAFGESVISDVKEGTLPIPQEKKELLNYRFKELFKKISSEESFKSSVDGLFVLFDQIQFYANQLKEKSSVKSKQKLWHQPESALNKLFFDMKLFISGFTQEEPLENLKDHTWEFLQLVNNDNELSSFFWDVRQFLFDIFENPELIEKEDFTNKWEKLWTKGQILLNDPKFKKPFNNFWFDLQLCLENIKKDSLQERLAEDASKLAKDLFLDTNGKPSFSVMATGLSNLRNLVLPIIKKNLQNVPIPPMSGTSETYDWNIEGLHLNGEEILPEHIEMKVWGKADVSLTNTPTTTVSFITMWVRNVQLEAKSLKFYFNRKSIPKLEERGTCDINIKGKNEIKITWRIEGEQDKPWLFVVEQVKCYLDNFDVYIKESTHTFLMKMITSLFSGSIKRTIEDKVEHNIVDSLALINDKMNETIQGFDY